MSFPEQKGRKWDGELKFLTTKLKQYICLEMQILKV